MKEQLQNCIIAALMISSLGTCAVAQDAKKVQFKVPPNSTKTVQAAGSTDSRSANKQTTPARATTRAQLMKAVNDTRYSPRYLGRLVKNFPISERSGLVEELMKSLRSKDWEVRVNAAYVLGECGPIAKPAAAEMITAMTTIKMANVGWEVQPALVKIGPGALPALKEALRKSSPDDEIHYELIEAAGLFGPQAQELAPLLTRFLQNGDNTGAVEAMTKIGPGTIPAICDGLSMNKEGCTTLYAARVLSSFKSGAVTASLLSNLKQASAQGKKNICEVFAELTPGPDKKAATALCSLVKTNDWDMRHNAIKALKNIGPAAVPDVVELLSDKAPSVYTAATEILQHYGPNASAAVPALTRMMDSPDREISMTAASTILKIDSNNKRAGDHLKAGLNNKDDQTRTTAAHYLAKAGAGATSAVPSLIKKMTDSNSIVRVQAARALGNIGPAAYSALTTLATAATSTHPPISNDFEARSMDGEVQREAIVAIGKILARPSAAINASESASTTDKSTATTALIKILRDSSKSYMHQYVLEAFTRMRSAASPAVPALIEVLKNKGSHHSTIPVLKAIGPGAKQAIPELQKLYDNKNALTRREAFSCIQAVEDNPINLTANAERMIKDKDHEVKNAAIETLILYPTSNPEIIKVLIAGLKDSQYNIVLSSIQAVGACGPKAAEALPLLINENNGCSTEHPKKELSFAAIKKIDPSGEKTMTIVQPVLNDSFKVRGSIELLEFIGSPKSSALAKATRDRWKLK